MQEIVPPKLNKETGMFSLLLNRRNVIIGIGFGISILLWSSFGSLSTDQKILMEMVVMMCVVPFMFSFYGRYLDKLFIDFTKYLLSKKDIPTLWAKEIIDNTLVGLNNNYSRVYRIEPINLFMSGDDEINAFKRYIQQALFSLKYPIQILTVQKIAVKDDSISVEEKRLQKLSGKLKERCRQFINEYLQMNTTMEKSFYLVLSAVTKDLATANRKIIEQENSFVKLLEQSKIKVTQVTKEEILEISDYILSKNND